MDFLYGKGLPDRARLPERDPRRDAGRRHLFTREDEVEEQWKLVDAIVSGWQRDRPNFPNYEAGTWGPAAADELVHRDSRSWRRH